MNLLVVTLNIKNVGEALHKVTECLVTLAGEISSNWLEIRKS